MRRTRLTKTATTMMTRIERERAVSSHQVVPDPPRGAATSGTGHRHSPNKRPMGVYYPGNILVRLLLGRRLEASGGGQCARRAGFVAFHAPERLQAKACPGPDPGWKPVRVKKTRQMEPRFDSIETGKAPEAFGHALKFMGVPILQAPEALLALSFRLDLANHRR